MVTPGPGLPANPNTSFPSRRPKFYHHIQKVQKCSRCIWPLDQHTTQATLPGGGQHWIGKAEPRLPGSPPARGRFNIPLKRSLARTGLACSVRTSASDLRLLRFNRTSITVFNKMRAPGLECRTASRITSVDVNRGGSDKYARTVSKFISCNKKVYQKWYEALMFY